jgi:hypothetical protein
MVIKKLANADFHVGNKLNGSKTAAKYGIFRDGKQVGWAQFSGVWNAYAIDFRSRLIDYSCGSLAELKNVLSAKS